MCTKKINIKNQVHYHYKKLIKPKKKKNLKCFIGYQGYQG